MILDHTSSFYVLRIEQFIRKQYLMKVLKITLFTFQVYIITINLLPKYRFSQVTKKNGQVHCVEGSAFCQNTEKKGQILETTNKIILLKYANVIADNIGSVTAPANYCRPQSINSGL